MRVDPYVYYSDNGNPILAVEMLETPMVREVLRKLAEYEDIGTVEEYRESKNNKKLNLDISYKIGDKVKATVFRQWNGNEATIYGKIVALSENKKVVKVAYNSDRTIDFYANDFGKTVFVLEENDEVQRDCTNINKCRGCGVCDTFGGSNEG